MRTFGALAVSFWRSTGKALRGDPETVALVAYLASGGSSHMSGLYPLALPLACHELGLAEESLRRSLVRLEELGFAFYCEEHEAVFVVEMAAIEIGSAMSAGDKRIKAISGVLAAHQGCHLLEMWLARYSSPYGVGLEAPSTFEEPPPDAPSGDGCKGPEAPSKSGQRQDIHRTEEEPPAEPADSTPSKMTPQRLFDEFSVLAEEIGLAKPRELTDQRRKRILARLKGHADPEWWAEVWRSIRRSPFAMGQNDRGWRLSIDWLIRCDDHPVRCIEGAFEQRNGGANGQHDDPWNLVPVGGAS